MKVEDIEKAVRLKRDLDYTSEQLKGLHAIARVGVDSFEVHPMATPAATMHLYDVSFGADLMLEALQLFVRVLEARYNEIHAEITAL